jgi:hypothetical protein
MSVESQDKQKPWYKQFWPWFLIALPLSSVIAGVTTVIIAANTTDSMVVDDYYKDGLAINESLAKKNKAKDMGIEAELVFSENKLLVKVTSKEAIKDSLFLNFQHATLSEKDFRLALKKDAKGNYYSELEASVDGSWFISLFPYQESWELEKKVTLPSSLEIRLGY